jgi:hypothetical protein
MHTILKVLTVTLLMLEAAGCSCTAIGCDDAFTVAFGKASKVWEPGKYVVSVDADGKKSSCTVDMPLVADPVCTNILVALHLIPTSDSSNELDGLERIVIFGTPSLVQVSVARDGVALGTNVFLPSYSENEPNGALCGPTCHQGGSELSVR